MIFFLFTDEKGKSTLDIEVLYTVLTSCTRVFLKDVVVEYEATSSQSFEKLIIAMCSGDTKKSILALCK